MDNKQVFINFGVGVMVDFGNPDLKREVLNAPFLLKYIPAIEYYNEDEICNKTFEIHLINNPASYPQINFIKSDEVILSGNFTDSLSETFLSSKDLITLIEYVFENFRQQNGIFCVHGAVCRKNSEAILFIGQVSGIGKTSTALYLSRHFNFDFYGDEKILINGKDMSIRSTVYSEKSLPKASLFVQPQICEGGTLSVEEWSSQKLEFHLYEEITRKIRGCSRRVCNFLYPIQSLDTPIISSDRVAFCQKAASLCSGLHILGDIKLVSQYIANFSRGSTKVS